MLKNIKLLAAMVLMLLVLHRCSSDSGNTPVGQTGKGGSMARFAITGNYLYTVDQTSLKTWNIINPPAPLFTDSTYIGQNTETLFGMGDKLFVGTQWGMYIYDISAGGSPRYVSEYAHIHSCDPVVAQGEYAYVTLNSENTWCGNNANELHVIDIANPAAPRLIKEYPMQLPKGLAISESTLFVCDKGLRIFDATVPDSLVEIFAFNMDAYDIIADEGHLIITGNDGIYQYLYANKSITRLSHIAPNYLAR